ncbi:hypothetical protein P3T27_000922 [Kitasatospora sp. MAA19]|nr:hypothetical protein [Kitasatospora sp. MAA19]MDH6704221.1 hypothetical protein [Kitasatospora sp. MAA19]
MLFADGRLVFRGTPEDLAAAGVPEYPGDSPLVTGTLLYAVAGP